MRFANRADAGRQLGNLLMRHRPLDPIVVGVTRGGVLVAAEVARLLDAPLEICVVRKLVAPGTAARTIGAVAEGDVTIVDDAAVARLGLTETDVAAIIDREHAEVVRASSLLRDRARIDVRGRDVILVDDGVITGHTIRAAIASVRARGPRQLELAVPFGAIEVIESLRKLDRVLCLDTDAHLLPGTGAIATRYTDFLRASDADVAGLLAASQRERAGRAVPRTAQA